ncbi:MAG: hypothetical protein ACPLQO_06180 [Desulfotomaculales bacterium]
MTGGCLKRNFVDFFYLKEIAPVYACKLNKAVGPTKFLVPLHGWNSIETEGSEFYEPEAVRTFIAGLKGNLKPGIEIREVDANIDDTAFAHLRGLILGIPADAWGGVFPRRWV